MKKVLVTGANGYIGSNVVKQLLDDGEVEVVAADIATNNIDDRATKINCNLFDVDPNVNLYEYFGKPDVVLHMAWIDGFVHKSDKHLAQLSAHYTFLSNLIQNGVSQVAVMGTMHEIGFYEGMIDENTPTNPLSMYGIAKNALRKAIELKCAENDVCYQWLRCFYIYGDDRKANSIFAKLLKASDEGKTTFPFTTGKNMYDFIHISELSKQISAAITQNDVRGIINCCSGKPMTLAEKVEQYIRDNNLNIQLQYGAFPDRPYDSKIVYGDSSKIESIMNNRKSKNVRVHVE